MSLSSHVQSATFHVATRPFTVDAKVEVTSGGLLAIAALVTGILLSTAAVVRAARR